MSLDSINAEHFNWNNLENGFNYGDHNLCQKNCKSVYESNTDMDVDDSSGLATNAAGDVIGAGESLKEVESKESKKKPWLRIDTKEKRQEFQDDVVEKFSEADAIATRLLTIDAEDFIKKQKELDEAEVSLEKINNRCTEEDEKLSRVLKKRKKCTPGLEKIGAIAITGIALTALMGNPLNFIRINGSFNKIGVLLAFSAIGCCLKLIKKIADQPIKPIRENYDEAENAKENARQACIKAKIRLNRIEARHISHLQMIYDKGL